MQSGITAILTGYNRPQNMDVLADAVRGQTIPPDDVWLWYNKGDEEQEQVDNVKAAYCNHNFGFYSRFAMALLAPTEYVAIFDDDTIPGERWFENCLETMKTSPGILGTVGVCLTGPQYRGHERVGWPTSNNETIPCDLVGHCWFMRKTDFVWMFVDAPYKGLSNGEDIHLASTAWRYDGIQCFVPPHPYNDKSLWGSIHGTLLGSDKAASSLKNFESHLSQRDAIVREEIQRGWLPIYMRESYVNNNPIPSQQSA